MDSYRQELRRDVESWRLADDTEWIESVARTATAGNGVVLYGDSGADQTELGRRVAHHLGERSGLLELACPPEAATSASLAALAANPPAPGRVLLIPDVASFTGPDLDLVARLVLRNGAVVVAVESGTRGAEAPLLQLTRLERVRVGRLTLESAADYLANGLDGPLSERAAFAVWDSSAGNRAMMRMIVEDWRESGYLVREDDVWVIRGATPPAGPRLVRHWNQWLGEQEPQTREVFEVLALSGELPLHVVMQICGANALDAVHDLGYLHLSDSAGRATSLRGTINTRAIAGQVPPGRSMNLLQRVTDHVEDIGLGQLAGLVPWRLRCGLPVEPSRFIDGAKFLLASTSPSDALDMLKLVPAEVEPERVKQVRISALLAAGQFVDLWIQIGNLRLEPSAVLGEGRQPLGRSPGRGPDGSEVAGRLTAPAEELIVATWRGDFHPMLEAASVQPKLAEGVGWIWQQAIHEALVLTGQVQEGLHADRELLHVIEQSDTAPFLVQRGRLGLFDMESVAGEWNRAAATLSSGWNAETGAPGQGRTGVLYNAIADVLRAEFSASASTLQREIPQLRALGRHDLLPLANAAHALSLACVGQRRAALGALTAVEIPPLVGSGVWRLTWAATYFSAQAMGQLGRIDAAVARLMAVADRDRRLGNYSQELLTLSAALQWGHEPALELLSAASERVNGRFAEACTWVVRGLRRGDPEKLEYGALLARTIGQHFFAGFAQRRLEALNGPCPRAATSARQSEAAGQGWVEASSTRQGLSALTPRQRDIVQHVLLDQSNGDIARSIGVSVRTVESHLYQAYSKLNVKNRAELRAFLADSSAAFPGESAAT